VSKHHDSGALEREMALLRQEVTGLEAKLSSYTSLDKGLVVKWLGGGLIAFAVIGAGVAGVLVIISIIGGTFKSCASQGPHHGPVIDR
jgi:hypothetical protein